MVKWMPRGSLLWPFMIHCKRGKFERHFSFSWTWLSLAGNKGYSNIRRLWSLSVNLHSLKRNWYVFMFILFVFQEAYTFWICSTHLPMWLLNSDNKNSVKVEACQSTCLTVEKQCPFLIKGTEDDMASGNPSFMCKGKTNLTKDWAGDWLFEQESLHTANTFFKLSPLNFLKRVIIFKTYFSLRHLSEELT